MSDTPKSNAELVARADKLIAALNARNRYFPLDVLDLIFKMKQALTTKQDGVTISSWAATEATEALKVVQADRYHMCSEYGEALSEILAALKQQEQSE